MEKLPESGNMLPPDESVNGYHQNRIDMALLDTFPGWKILYNALWSMPLIACLRLNFCRYTFSTILAKNGKTKIAVGIVVIDKIRDKLIVEITPVF